MKCDCNGDGFTLIELITVITILGVLAVVVGPRFASTGVYDERTFYDDVLQAIRFAQTRATAFPDGGDGLSGLRPASLAL